MPKQSWEEEFDKQFNPLECFDARLGGTPEETGGEIKDFIRHLLSQERQKVNEEWRESIELQKVIGLTEKGKCCEAYRRACEDLLKK